MHHQPPFAVRALPPGRRPGGHILIAVANRADAVRDEPRHQINPHRPDILELVLVEFVEFALEDLPIVVDGDDVFLGEEQHGTLVAEALEFGDRVGGGQGRPEGSLIGDDFLFDAIVDGRHCE